jgi:integrase/recombinase XerC
MKLIDAIHKFSDWKLLQVVPRTMMGYDFELRMFCLFMRNPEVEHVALRDVTDYLNGMKELGWKQNSFTHKCSYLRKFFRFLRLQGYSNLNEELIPIPKREFKPPRIATEDDYRALLGVIPQNRDPRHIRNRSIINLLWDTGARVGEIVALDTGELDHNRMRAVIRTEKSRGRRPFREIFWTHQTNENLGKWLDKRSRFREIKDPDALFICASSHQAGQRMKIHAVAQMLRNYSRKAGRSYINAHSFRHHMGHDIIHRGGSSADVMNILGHATLASSTVYTMMTDRELEERYRKFKGH